MSETRVNITFTSSNPDGVRTNFKSKVLPSLAKIKKDAKAGCYIEFRRKSGTWFIEAWKETSVQFARFAVLAMEKTLVESAPVQKKGPITNLFSVLEEEEAVDVPVAPRKAPKPKKVVEKPLEKPIPAPVRQVVWPEPKPIPATSAWSKPLAPKEAPPPAEEAPIEEAPVVKPLILPTLQDVVPDNWDEMDALEAEWSKTNSVA